MSKIKLLFFILAVTGSIYYYGCDDSGIVTDPEPKGGVSFSPTNLKTLETGAFELWLSLVDSNNIRTWYSLGQFNISSTGSMVDLGGAAMKFKFQGDTNLLDQSKDVLLTFEVDNDLSPSNYRIMSGIVSVSPDSIIGDMKISGDEALGNLGRLLLGDSAAPAAAGDYILGSPTTNNVECLKGLWLCDDNGVSHFTPGLDLTGSLAWKYQGWVVNNSTQQYSPTGKFSSFESADEDGPGLCAGSSPAYNKPGQEFAAGCPNGDILNNGNYGFFITLEPNGVTLTRPFFLKLFFREVIQLGYCGQRDIYFRPSAIDGLLPKGHIRIIN
jgi:hypothetical protein